MSTLTSRRKTRPVRVGNITIGGDSPIVVQSMITEETRNVSACVDQIIRMHDAGAEIVRVTTPTIEEAHCLGEIQSRLRSRGVAVPLVADVHHQGTAIAALVAEFVDKVRLNPASSDLGCQKARYRYAYRCQPRVFSRANAGHLR